MIKKLTTAHFKDGGYAGDYDWKGGIPLSVGESIAVTIRDGSRLNYLLVDKTVDLKDKDEDQDVAVKYYFELAA